MMNKEFVKTVLKLLDHKDVTVSDVQEHPLYPYDVVVGTVVVGETVLPFRLPVPRGSVG